ncbi:hypothetical protein MVLG_04542 [Microbotryum lychnidis-dioicae p1A1 Lamole]|uniref:Zn(2)-C6 fungal-type domain-containing protein n=1 Tax=Microbotryum lychnidis-dioicae (strain p1A1 Lamole / MvSl-1064) TaxID=683840 RepID=U5HBJ2_USTV1|nr:hypothetical protein MVLG_04542 [Microbotryum lychnidis-dioicae p1A1 Lamole]|eukprot:KDE05102.1 hypothetical protein MVLG_04542 [Microbotryum lychnidis-dioicae p1A1 Lamole]
MVARPASASLGPIAPTSSSSSAAVVPPHQHPPPHSPLSDSEERAPKKQKRVTKACDQCRRRRVKCEAFPNALSIDSPCVICTEQGSAHECSFTRPTRKRGPQAGLTKNLAERITGLERFVGYLLAVEGEEMLMAKYRAFFDQSDSSTDAAAQMAAWNRSQLSHLLENLVISPNTSSAPAIVKQEQQRLDSELGVHDVVMDGSSPANSRPSAPSLQDLSPAAAASTPGTATRVGSDPFQGGSGGLKGTGTEGDGSMASLSSNVVLSLSDEAIRNQMLDVYFHQIVRPTLPILDKAQFFSWSAYLPPTDAATSIAAQALPAELYLSVFAVVAPYLHSDSTHSSETFATAARFYLYSSMKDPSVETVQACTLLAIADWGLNEMSRAWILSSLSIALSITLGMHLRQQHDSRTPTPSRLRTFHAAIIVHTVFSLRLSRPPIINCEDYDVPLPPSEGSENFELWSLRHNANHLRGEYALEPIATIARRPGAVRSSTLLLFSKTASLCTLGLAVLRWSLRPAAGGDHGEVNRQNLIKALVAWERGLPPELMIGEPSTRGTDRVKERSRSIIKMHMTLHSLYARLSPSQEAVAEEGRAFSYDPAPESISMLLQLTTTSRDLFTYLRTMPSVEMALDVLVKAGLGEDPSVSGAYEELGRVHRLVRRQGVVSRLSAPNMATPLSTEGGYDSPINAFVQMHPMSQVNRPPHPLTSSLHGTTQPAKDSSHASLVNAEALSVPTEPFQAFLSYSDVLGPSATASTVLDFGSWDQSDLLVSLGLVSDPTAGSQAWQPPPSSDMSGSHNGQHLPVLDESKPISLRPMATTGATEFPHSGLNDGEVGHGNSHTSIGHTTPLRGEGNNAAFMFENFGQGTDLLARWLDRDSWATGSSGEPIQGLSTGDSEQDLPSNTGMMLDPSSGEGMMM